MRVAIRVDASTAMGLGHLKRCVSLGKALRALDAEVSFVTRDLGLDAAARLHGEGFEAFRLQGREHPAPAPASDDPPHAPWAGVTVMHDAAQTIAALSNTAAQWDWVVVDSYAFDARWHRGVRDALGARICVIDDLADRALDCDLLVDHNAASNHRSKYAARTAARTRILGGPRFALLDPKYEHAAVHLVRPQVRSIGVFMGGTDPWNASIAAVRACRIGAAFDGPIEIATTRANPFLDELEALRRLDSGVSLLVDAPDLSEFFARHDLQIGAGGGAVWERCRVGSATIALVLADNHRASLDALSKAGAVLEAASTAPEILGAAVATLSKDAPARARLSARARELVDGRGAARVALAMAAATLALRPARAQDARPVLAWRNAEVTRRHFRDPSELDAQAHVAWWTRCLASPEQRLLIAHCGSCDVGVLRLDIAPGGAQAEVSLYLDPALHGLGLGAALLTAAQAWTRQHEPSLGRLMAEVLPGNEASAAAFRAARFQPDGDQHWTWSPPQ